MMARERWPEELSNAVSAGAADTVELVRRLVAASADGQAAIDGVVEAAMTAAGASVEALEYAPREVALVDEFVSAKAGDPSRQRCLIGRVAGGGADRAGAGCDGAGGGRRGRSLLLFAHPDPEAFTDTPAWTLDAHDAVLRDGRLYGWGVADDFAGIAMMVGGLAALNSAGLRPAADLTLVSSPSKRHRRGIAAALHRGVRADGAVYLHPAESGRGLDEIKALAPGQLEFVVTVRGRPPDTLEPAHTAFAHTAENPVGAAPAILSALSGLDRRRGERLSHPVLQQAIGRSANLMVTHLAAGAFDTLSRIPTVCRIGAAMTLVPGEKLDDVMAETRLALAAAAAAVPWLRERPPEIEWRSGVSAAETPPSADLYRTVAGILDLLGATPRVNPLHTSSDIRNPIVQSGIPTVGFGPLCGGLTMSGGTDEWVDVADLHRAILATAAVIAEWCGLVEGSAT